MAKWLRRRRLRRQLKTSWLLYPLCRCCCCCCCWCRYICSRCCCSRCFCRRRDFRRALKERNRDKKYRRYRSRESLLDLDLFGGQGEGLLIEKRRGDKKICTGFFAARWGCLFKDVSFCLQLWRKSSEGEREKSYGGEIGSSKEELVARGPLRKGELGPVLPKAPSVTMYAP